MGGPRLTEADRLQRLQDEEQRKSDLELIEKLTGKKVKKIGSSLRALLEKHRTPKNIEEKKTKKEKDYVVSNPEPVKSKQGEYWFKCPVKNENKGDEDCMLWCTEESCKYYQKGYLRSQKKK